jgi:hypothetical protein
MLSQLCNCNMCAMLMLYAEGIAASHNAIMPGVRHADNEAMARKLHSPPSNPLTGTGLLLRRAFRLLEVMQWASTWG